MFTNKITESDAFLDMPLSSQALYFHLCMYADDDGFVKNPKRIGRMIGASEDEFKLLIAKSFVFNYDSGVIVIKHWRMHNLLRKDRYNETEYLEEKSSLYIKENGAYTLDESQGKPLLATNRQPSDNQTSPQYRLGKDSKDKESIEDNAPSLSCFVKEVVDYLNQSINGSYKHTTEKTQRCIKARINEGFVVDDFKTVIDKKVAEWSGTDMEKYLRPETLFGTKFESYLNQKSTSKKTSSGKRSLFDELMNCEVD